MTYLDRPVRANRAWAGSASRRPGVLRRLADIQRPELLWIGCSDSRVPANEIVGLAPGELFVHRNVANLVPVTDLNAMAVIEYAVSSLGVRHIIVCGHYGCGGVRAALKGHQAGAVALWLQPLRNLADEHRASSTGSRPERRAGTGSASSTWPRRSAPSRSRRSSSRVGARRALAVHGWIYDLGDGLLRDLGVTVGRRDGGRLETAGWTGPRGEADVRAPSVGGRRPSAAPAPARRRRDDALARRSGDAEGHPEPVTNAPGRRPGERTGCSPSPPARQRRRSEGSGTGSRRGAASWCGSTAGTCCRGAGQRVATAAAALMIDDVRRRGSYRHRHAIQAVGNVASNAPAAGLGFGLLGEVVVDYPTGV